MFIRVVYKDGKFDMVKPQLLDFLLQRNKLIRFKRSTGWAVIGRDAIRTGRTQGYWGEDRRAS